MGSNLSLEISLASLQSESEEPNHSTRDASPTAREVAGAWAKKMLKEKAWSLSSPCGTEVRGRNQQ